MLRLLPAAIIIIVSIYSCSSGTDAGDITLLKEVNKSLLESNHTTKLSTNNIFEVLKDKTKDPVTSERAIGWISKATTIRTLTDSIIHRIEQIKSDLIEEAGFDPVKEESPESAKHAVDHIFKEHKEGQLLHEKLALYKNNLFAIAVDSFLQQHMKNLVSITGTDMVSKENSFTDKYFNTTLLGAITMLTKIENDIRITENKLTTFCNENVSSGCILTFSLYNPIVTQSATIVRPGEDVEIKAGVGAYATESMPVVVIGGKQISLTPMGYSQYNFKASSKPGTYQVPVRIKYFDQTVGKQIEVEQIIKYTVKPDQ